MKVLVVGGAGYIGSHICKELFRQGHTPIVYDNLSNGHEEFVKWGEFEIGDVQDTSRLYHVLKQYNPEIVIHLAAYAYVGESIIDPSKYYNNNVCGTISLLEVMRACEIKKIVFSSSCATYGIPKRIPITEDEEQNPINPYGASKMMTERILKDYVRAYGFQAISLRYFNAAGSDPDKDIGEIHNPEPHLIPIICNVALGKSKTFKLLGSDYDTPDGSCIRDYTHVSDIASAHVKAIKYMEDPLILYDDFNLGTGKGYSVIEIIKTFEAISSKIISVDFAKRRVGDPPILIADASKAYRILGWTPKYNIDAMIQSTWNFLSAIK